MEYYERTEPTLRVNVLGAEYRVFLDVPAEEDGALEEYAGYCDNTAHMIAVAAKDKDSDLGQWEEYRKRVLRHELIHAFLFESGLGGDAVWHVAGQTHPEQTVDWIARQFPKMLETFQAAGAL